MSFVWVLILLSPTVSGLGSVQGIYRGREGCEYAARQLARTNHYLCEQWEIR